MKSVTFRSLKNYFVPMAVLSFPIALQSLVSFLVNLCDNVMIGRLGDTAVSAVYMGTQTFTMLQWFITGITVSMTILASQYWGRQDTGTIKKITAIGLLIGLPVSLLLTAASLLFPEAILGLFTNETNVIEEGIPYLQIVSVSFPFYLISQVFVAALRSVENTKTGFYFSTAALLLNIVLNLLLIFGYLGFPAMGSRGAAAATLVARIFETALILVYIFRKEKTLRFRLRELVRIDPAILRLFFRYGLPVLIGELVWGFNMLMRSYFMGHYSTEVITAYSMVNLLSNTAFVWLMAMEAASGILTGKMIGAGKKEEIRPYTYNMQVLFILLGAAAVAVLFLVRIPFFALYNVSAEAKAEAMKLSYVMIFVAFFSAYEDMTLCGIVKCGGETTFVLKTDSIFVFLTILPGCLIASHFNAPAWVMFLILFSDQVLKCGVAAVKTNRFRWAHNLTELSDKTGGEN